MENNVQIITGKKKKFDLKTMCLLAMFIAVAIVMKITGIGLVKIGPLSLNFLTISVAICAILLGPFPGTVMGVVVGLCSLLDAINGTGGLATIFFSISWLHTIILCVGTRALMGFCTGLLFRFLKKVDKTKTLCYFAGGFSAAFFNTLFFMSYLVLVFYQTETVQEKVASLGAGNFVQFIVLFVGLQALIEMAVCAVLAGCVSKSVDMALHKK